MARKHHSRKLLVLFMMLLGWQSPALAQSEVALEVTAQGSESDSVQLSLAELDAMAQVTFDTSTIWTDGDATFSGVSLAALLENLGLEGSNIEMVALNDYKVVMPLDVIDADAPIIATRMNGETMSVRDKGPYWIVFPYDLDAKYQSETIYSYSIWQLNRLKIVD